MKPLVVENDILRLVALPEVGGKIISFFVKPAQKELLSIPRQPYRIPHHGGSFADYDTSGWDEMLPTIDPCRWNAVDLPDHGEAWSLPWTMQCTPDSLIGSVRCQTLPLLFSRTIAIEGRTCSVRYEIENSSPHPQPYLWAWHALWDTDSLQIELPTTVREVIPVHTNTFLGDKDTPVSWPVVSDHDLRNPSTWQGKKTAKIYLLPDTPINTATLHWPNVSLHVAWDEKLLPYTGIWYNHGGFKNEYNLAIEPATGYYDRLDTAVSNNTASILPPFGKAQWTLSLTIHL